MLSRKYHNTLYISGVILIAFSAWGVLRNLAFMFLSNESAAVEYSTETVKIMTLILTGIIVLIDFLLRVYVGKSAIAEGKGQHRSMKYVVLAILMLAFSVFGILLLCLAHDLVQSRTTIVISVLVEITSAANTFELTYSAFKVKKIHKETV